jgi:uncharacterized protein YdhG (YjbR/CyaY superfamily)
LIAIITTPMLTTKFKTVDEYLSALSPKSKKLMIDLRKIIKQSAPEAEEVISYNMPAIKFHGIVVYYAAHTNHIGFYPGNSVTNEIFKDDLTKYETSKGTVKFRFGKPIPTALIKKIVKYRVMENLLKAKAKLSK